MGTLTKQRQINFFSIVGTLLLLIAAAQCAVPFLYYGYNAVIGIRSCLASLSYSAWDLILYGLPSVLSNGIESLSAAFLSLVLLLTAITLLRGRKGKMLRACAILLVVQSVSIVFLRLALDLILLFAFNRPFSNELMIVWQMFEWIPTALFALFIVSACGHGAGTRRLWPWLVFFIPSFAYATFNVFGFLPLNDIIYNCEWDFSIYFTDGPSLRYLLPWFILKVNEFLQIHTMTLAYFVVGLWIACPKKKKKGEAISTAEAEPIPTGEIKDYSDIADELYRFKNLLDAGAITQEEYDNIRKRLLGL